MISFSVRYINFILNDPEKKKEWLRKTITHEGKRVGDINYILCSDEFLEKINWQFLQHDTLTDIITFSNSTNDSIISGDIYISLDRVRSNAQELALPFDTELERVLIHGILHLVGYNDHSPDEKRQMRAKEDYYLHLLL